MSERIFKQVPIIGFLRILDMLFYAVRAIYAVNFASPPENLILPTYSLRKKKSPIVRKTVQVHLGDSDYTYMTKYESYMKFRVT